LVELIDQRDQTARTIKTRARQARGARGRARGEWWGRPATSPHVTFDLPFPDQTRGGGPEFDRMDLIAAQVSEPIAGPVVTKRKRESTAFSEKKKRNCLHCAKGISCSVLPSGNVDESGLRAHEKTCKKNPNRVVRTVRGLKASDVFGPLGSDAEFQAPEAVRNLTQGRNDELEDAIHVFPDRSWHPVLGKKNGKPITAHGFFVQGYRCCADEDTSMLQFRLKPDLFPKMYDSNGRCLIAEIGTDQVAGAPEPWSISVLRKFPLNFNEKLEVFCLGCKMTIKMHNASCAQGQGPCRNCTGNRPNIVIYKRSFQAYLDAKNLKWTTFPDARTILACHASDVKFTCTLCNETWPSVPSRQVQANLGCPGCEVRHRAELCAYKLYSFVFPGADMLARGQARLEGVHKNPFDVASANVKIIIEVMSLKWHVEAGRLSHDMEKMIAVLRAGYVYIMVHHEDRKVNPERERAWMRCIVAALRLAEADPTPRVIHVRRDAHWDAYDCMRDAALAAGFPYEDVFCGDVNAHATERLPGETHVQSRLV
jgi:hypothetical protein